MSGLTVCPACGWHRLPVGGHECASQAGALAAQLAAAVPEIPATQLGYGTGYLTFELDEETHVRFYVVSVDAEGRVAQGRDTRVRVMLREVFAIGEITVDQAAALVRAVAAVLGKAPKP